MNSTQQIIQQVLMAWRKENKKISDFFDKHGEGYYHQPIAPGKNRAIYLLGHLIAVNDALLPLFALGERKYPTYEALFLKGADNPQAHYPSVAELKQQWAEVNAELDDHFNKMTAENWLDRHQSVSPEDFAKDPLRNKLNVLMNRTVHQSYHLGQLVLLEKTPVE